MTIDSICECELIASSSLHGIIAADAYGVPSIWIEFSNKIVGNRFKFLDYFLSVGRKYEKPFLITKNTTLQDIHNQFHKYEINLDFVKLLEACPFLKDTEKDKLKNRLKPLHLLQFS